MTYVTCHQYSWPDLLQGVSSPALLAAEVHHRLCFRSTMHQDIPCRTFSAFLHCQCSDTESLFGACQCRPKKA